jgi:hypothetical protein
MGTVVKLFFTQPSFPPNQCAPYQIRLDEGRLVYAPADKDGSIRRVRTGAQAELERMQRPTRLRRLLYFGLQGHETWRLTKSELWLPSDVILKIAKISLDRAHELAHRLAVARLSTVCKVWDAALLPLFHPGVPGVISPAELRKLKRLALDPPSWGRESVHTATVAPAAAAASTASPPCPHSDLNGPSVSMSQHTAPHGSLLPERMLPAAGPAPSVRTALTEGLVLSVREAMLRFYNDIITGEASTVGEMVLFFIHLRHVLGDACIHRKIQHLLKVHLYTRGSRSASHIDLVALFTNTVCTAYRVLMVIKAVEARAIALGESAVNSREQSTVRPAPPLDPLSVSLAALRAPSPTGMLAQLAWDVHRESSEGYLQMSQSLLAGSGATSLPTPAAGAQDLLVRALSHQQLVTAHFPMGIAQDLLRKARQLFPLVLPGMGLPVRTPKVGQQDSQSCFASRLHCFLRPDHVSDLEAALCSAMHDLLGRSQQQEEEEEEVIWH